MSQPILIFETDTKTGTPRLQPVNGFVKNLNERDLNQMEDILRPLYEKVVRDGDLSIDYKGATYLVTKRTGDNSRQPTLELRTEQALTSPTLVRTNWKLKPLTLPAAQPQASLPQSTWGTLFLAEIDGMIASDDFGRLVPTEKAMLILVRDELRGMMEQQPPRDAALFFLVSILMTAENLSRTQRPTEPQPYTFALSGLERLFRQAKEPPHTPWGDLPAPPLSNPPPSWLGRLWSRFARTGWTSPESQSLKNE